MVAKTIQTDDIADMVKATSLSKNGPMKRGKGRPVSGENDVGRERLLAATETLLRTMPPARVTISRIAREANADPALIRYYFGNRAALLVEVVNRVTAHPQRDVRQKGEPLVALADHIARTVQLVRRAPYLHRLIHDELRDTGTEESRARVRQMNLDLVDFYRTLLNNDDGSDLVAANPLFLHLAVLGASDFFASAEPMIRELLPDGADPEKSSAEFQSFLINLFLNGMRRR